MRSNNISELTTRTEPLVDALAESIISTAEAAAERLDLAARVAQIQQRMNAFSAVLESVGAQKAVLLKKLDEPALPKYQRMLIERQVDLLTQQECAILERAGATPAQARDTVHQLGNGDSADPDQEPNLYRREGRRFVATHPGSPDQV